MRPRRPHAPTATSVRQRASDAVLLPYHHFDSQSGVGTTAVAFEKPMIVSDTGGLPDLVADRRWVVRPGDPAALAAAMADCLQTPGALDRLAADAAAIRRTLSWSHIAKKTRAVYGAVLARCTGTSFRRDG